MTEEIDGMVEIQRIKKQVMEDVMAFRGRGKLLTPRNLHQVEFCCFPDDQSPGCLCCHVTTKEVNRAEVSMKKWKHAHVHTHKCTIL